MVCTVVETEKVIRTSVLHVNVRTPDFVHILSSVQVLSTFCPMIVQFLTTFCLCPAFDYFLSQNFQFLSRSVPVIVLISLADLIFVHLLSTHLTPIQAKSRRQKLVKSWTGNFLLLPSSYPVAGQTLDNLRTFISPIFVHILSKVLISPQILIFYNLTKTRHILDIVKNMS